MRKFAAIAAASGASFLVGSLIGPQLNDLLPKINSPLFQQAQAASALAVANPTDVLTNLTNKPSAEMKLDDEFWKKPSRASEIMKFGYPGFDNLRTFEDFVLSYDRRTRTAHWVIEHLSPDRMTYDASVDRSKSEFKPDNSIHPYFRSQNSDYFRSGYDRGHLAAAGNHRRTQKSIDETFYLTNMSPQVGKGFNRDKWNDLERYIRKLAKKHKNIYVCTGPLYLPCQEADGNFYVKYKLIGANRVAVPTHFFKVALIETDRDKYEMEAYMMPNQFIPDEKPISDFLVPLESIERAAGFLIFEHANDKVVKFNGQSTGRKLLNFL